jgi:hypothetical protein
MKVPRIAVATTFRIKNGVVTGRTPRIPNPSPSQNPEHPTQRRSSARHPVALDQKGRVISLRAMIQ